MAVSVFHTSGAIRGFLDHYAGFLYSAAYEPPDTPDENPWREVDRRDTHWWWVSR